MNNCNIITFALAVLFLVAAPVKGQYLLNTFTVTGFSAQWTAYNDNATNLLPTNNPSASPSTFWNSGAGWGDYPQPYWVSFDLGTFYKVFAFQLAAIGDTTHDPQNFELQTSPSVSGTYTTVASFTAAAGTSSIQSFILSTPVQARFWKLNILNTYSQYQACVSYVNFFGNGPSFPCAPWTGASLSSGAIVMFYAPTYTSDLWVGVRPIYGGYHPNGLVLTSSPANFTLQSVAASLYPNGSGQQGALHDPQGNAYQGDFSGNYLIEGTANWNLAWFANPVAPYVQLYLNQISPPLSWGYSLGIDSAGGQTLVDFPLRYNFTLLVCNVGR